MHLAPFFSDPFAQTALEANINWTGWELLPALIMLLILLFTIKLSNQQRWSSAFPVLFLGSAVFLFVTLIFFVNRIEGYSQRAAIDFFKSKANEDCYITPYGYKSYGHLFYADKKIQENQDSYSKHWLLNGEIDKDLYIITKVHKTFWLKNIKLEEVGRANGFVMYKRHKKILK